MPRLRIHTSPSPLPYEEAWQHMRQHVMARASLGGPGQDSGEDVLWWLEHQPAYTLGVRKQMQHLHTLPKDIPLVASDRGGEVTYHGPGQWVLYVMVDLARLSLVGPEVNRALENATVEALQAQGFSAFLRPKEPGVYIQAKDCPKPYQNSALGYYKLASLGLRVKQHISYHGLALNIQADLSPFKHINPCGFSGLEMMNLTSLRPDLETAALRASLERFLVAKLYPQPPDSIIQTQGRLPFS